MLGCQAHQEPNPSRPQRYGTKSNATPHIINQARPSAGGRVWDLPPGALSAHS